MDVQTTAWSSQGHEYRHASGPVLTSQGARLLTVCQLASSLWQQAGFYMPTQSQPPVWSLKVSLGPCREGLLSGQGLQSISMCLVCIKWGWGGSRNQVEPSVVWSECCYLQEPIKICTSFPRSICHLHPKQPFLCLWLSVFIRVRRICQVKKEAETQFSFCNMSERLVLRNSVCCVKRSDEIKEKRTCKCCVGVVGSWRKKKEKRACLLLFTMPLVWTHTCSIM